MNILEELLFERQQLLKKKEAAQNMCNMPSVQFYNTLLEQIDQAIEKISQKKTE